MINRYKKNKTLILIPSRLESSRLPRKPLRLIGGIPMIARVAINAKKLGMGKVVVAAGNKEIINVLNKFNIDSVITSSDHKSGTDRIYEAYRKIKNDFDVVVNLQGDLPFFSDDLLPKTVDLMNDKLSEIGSAVCALKKEEIRDLNVVKAYVKFGKNKNAYSLDFKRKIKVADNYYHHIGLYVFKPKALEKFVNLKPSKLEKKRKLEQMRALENSMKIKLVKVNENPISIDTEKDLREIRLLFRKKNKNKYNQL